MGQSTVCVIFSRLKWILVQMGRSCLHAVLSLQHGHRDFDTKNDFC